MLEDLLLVWKGHHVKNRIERILAMAKKEFLQMRCDKLEFFCGVYVGFVLILLCYSFNLDMHDSSMAVVLQDSSPLAQDVARAINAAEWTDAVFVNSRQEAQRMMDERKIESFLVIPADFTKRLHQGEGKVQLVIYGVTPLRPTLIQSYAEAALAKWANEKGQNYISLEKVTGSGAIDIRSRLWFNERDENMLPVSLGVFAYVVIGLVSLFISLVIVKEIEFRSATSVLMTPLAKAEFFTGLCLPHYIFYILCSFFYLLEVEMLFRIPLRGSLWVFVCGLLVYLFACCGLGAFIAVLMGSRVFSVRFVVIFVASGVPILCGLVYDLQNALPAINFIGHLFPATYCIEFLKTLFLTGNSWLTLIKDLLWMLVFAGFFWMVSFKLIDKR